jgi:predicted dehydrogenase
MKQLIQNFGTGGIELAEVPCPPVKPGHVLIATRRSVISSGTERTITEFAGAGLISKARQRPGQVKAVIERVRSQGVRQTVKAVKDRLERWYPLGYCNVGTVIAAGRDAAEFSPGMRVACNGHHSEIVSVAKHLCAIVPSEIDDDTAAFTVLGAIALQGVRLAQPTLGERFAVIGLGLVGLLTLQILRAHGCQVLAMDPSAERARIGGELGAEIVTATDAETILRAASEFARGGGIDGVLITAATDSDAPLHNAAQMCRKRGRIVLVGTTGLTLQRADFYEKELSFQVSCSYGPGRYDANYEEGGQDYPPGFVRWTEQRNFTAILDLMAAGGLQTEALISHRFAFDDAGQAYDLLVGGQASLGIMLDYEAKQSASEEFHKRTVILSKPRADLHGAAPCVALVGAGNYAAYALLPALQKAGVRLHTMVSSGRPETVKLAKKYGFERVTTDIGEILSDGDINCIVIATRHDSHAELARQALKAGKNVFVEKPLAITREQMRAVQDAYAAAAEGPRLMIGYNRRFAPLIVKAKELLRASGEAKSLIYTVNAGHVPKNHWALAADIGGGRIIGEVCHFVDLAGHLIGADIVSLQTLPARSSSAGDDDGVSATLQFADGSIAAIHYLTNGHSAIAKERLEIHCAGRSLLLDDFKTLEGYGWPGFHKLGGKSQDKGNAACMNAFLQSLSAGEASPIPFAQIVTSMEAVFRMDELGRWSGEPAGPAPGP